MNEIEYYKHFIDQYIDLMNFHLGRGDKIEAAHILGKIQVYISLLKGKQDPDATEMQIIHDKALFALKE